MAAACSGGARFAGVAAAPAAAAVCAPCGGPCASTCTGAGVAGLGGLLGPPPACGRPCCSCCLPAGGGAGPVGVKWMGVPYAAARRSTMPLIREMWLLEEQMNCAGAGDAGC